MSLNSLSIYEKLANDEEESLGTRIFRGSNKVLIIHPNRASA